MVDNYNIIAEQSESTVMAHYEVMPRDAEAYQSEAALEDKLIKQLVNQGYENPKIKDEEGLIVNLRTQLERLNGYKFNDAEWKRLLDADIANDAMDIEDKTALIQKGDTIISLKRDNGESKNIKLIDKRNLGNNHLQVIHQYVPSGGTAKNRYDVTILVNGLPMVHIELKRRGGTLREAFNQIDRYQRESFWAGKALFEYVQIFVISNGTQTKYYSNTTRISREKETERAKGQGRKIESNSFEFTSYWSDAENNIISDLEDFANTFLRKQTLLNVLTKFCVFTVDEMLMAMRPYQIAATERILLRIDTAIKNRWQGSKKAGGYIWHTTGSGKTLTSFKTAQLAARMDQVKKVLFVVDRQDLDYQTMKEYDNFEKDCANSNTSSTILERQLRDDNAKIIITTIQKLSIVLKRRAANGEELSLLKDNVVLIFDECHRSQFGDMHKLVTKSFKKYMMFGFTGTPIFAENANKYGTGDYQTTAQVFGGELDERGQHTRPLHTYTIVDAIRDKNVLKFHVDYVSTMKEKDGVEDKKVRSIDEKKALTSDKRVTMVVDYILEHFDQKTKQSDGYSLAKLTNISDVIKKGRGVEEKKAKVSAKGFNSILAVDSVEMAKAYYLKLKERMKEDGAKQLRIATIFTYEANEASKDATGLPEEDPAGVGKLDKTSKEFLSNVAIPEYNKLFNTEYDISGDKFQNYYKDISLRMKNKELDLLIVVGMFLTGFDAKTLNTLWVDKNLKMHGLLQAYSRTNRILNSVKNCGNIVCFRNLEEATNQCFALFGNRDATGLVFMRPFKDYYEGYDDEKGKHNYGYKEIVNALLERFPIETLWEITDEDLKKEFIKLFGSYLKAHNLLLSFDEFCPDDTAQRNEIRIMKEGMRQDYLSWYNDLYDEFRQSQEHGERADIVDDIEFEMELVKQVQIDITYILTLVEQYKNSQCRDREILLTISRSVMSSPDLRNKKDLIEKFIDRMTPEAGEVHEEWDKYLAGEKKRQLDEIVVEEKLNPEKAQAFIDRAFKDGYVEENGTAITEILPPMPLFGGGNKRAETKTRVINKIKEFFDRFANI